MGITLITLKDYPNLITALFLIYLSAYVKVLDKTKGEKWRLVLTGLIFTIYGTTTESIIIGKTGILNRIMSVKPTFRFKLSPFSSLSLFLLGLYSCTNI